MEEENFPSCNYEQQTCEELESITKRNTDYIQTTVYIE